MLPKTSASCKRSFAKTKAIKSYLKSIAQHGRSNDISIVSIERKVATDVHFENIINKFVSKKGEKSSTLVYLLVYKSINKHCIKFSYKFLYHINHFAFLSKITNVVL